MKNLKENIIMLMKDFNEKESNKLQIPQLLRLTILLEKLNIDDEILIDGIEKLIGNLELIKSGNSNIKKTYNKSYYKLKQKIQRNYSIFEKGSYTK